MKVLAVSDSMAVSMQLAAALVSDDIEILEVRTPQRALQQIDDEGGFDIVVADADTAPTGGFALSRDIKARGRMGLEAPPVVLLLGRTQDKFLAKWSEADAFILKPADPFDLSMVVRAVTAGEPVPNLPHVGATRDVPDALGVPDGQRTAPAAKAGP